MAENKLQRGKTTHDIAEQKTCNANSQLYRQRSCDLINYHSQDGSTKLLSNRPLHKYVPWIAPVAQLERFMWINELVPQTIFVNNNSMDRYVTQLVQCVK